MDVPLVKITDIRDVPRRLGIFPTFLVVPTCSTLHRFHFLLSVYSAFTVNLLSPLERLSRWTAVLLLSFARTSISYEETSTHPVDGISGPFESIKNIFSLFPHKRHYRALPYLSLYVLRRFYHFHCFLFLHSHSTIPLLQT